MNKKSIKNTIYFLCSPSLGLLDNWLPIIWNLKNKRNDLKFIIIFPKPNIIRQISLSNILIILGSKIFDNIVLKTEGGSWVIADSFLNAIENNKKSIFEKILIKIILKLKKMKITKIAGNIIHFLYAQYSGYINRKFQFSWQLVEENGLCILYDIYDESKPYNLELMKNFHELPKFSIQHGININEGGVLSITKKLFSKNLRKDVKAYLFSSMEVPIYKHKYAIDNSSMQIIGIPRHNPDWMEFIRSNIPKENNEINLQDNGSIFIISRPGGTNYFPYERKKKALEDIKRLAWKDLKKNIIIKLHPKERKEGIYEEVFGTDTYGYNWVYSDNHPFVLAEDSDFAISFYSGVVIDMLALGIPTIEYLDLRGIPEYDNDESLRDKMDHPVFSYRYLNLVLGTSNYEMMRAHAKEIMNNRENVLYKLQKKYNELFPTIKNINNKIAQDILDVSDKKVSKY
tara:strand:- start:21613 stop:22983 length:1371 start_codon:yes stop_codon:yes gene_type:complete